MPIEIAPPRISSKLIAASQPVAGEKIKAGRGKEAEAEGEKHDIEHRGSPTLHEAAVAHPLGMSPRPP